ncbi:valine--tRNA ligase [Fibrobacter sp. UWH1]|uniref:valine--tRNA ligase n=1 Tax=Fibrobacter sp. UWH1 TaxID=1964354 RepID=UPI000B5201CF|nr:valine--tRNA ligase [Fibrobacter sp. UWH1]OWV04532.1 valine--tRNA ligase [Fibrobacter sp. UWH1]
METRYNSSEVEARWHETWAEKNSFAPSGKGEPFSVVIPPPNVTGALHLGHALNDTLQDILVRYRRKTGRDTLWISGTDHAGIATQAVVEKRLFQDEHKTRHDIGRDALVERIWKWKEEYEARITKQLKSLGVSCDWSRQRFTLDPICAKAVRHAFFNLFKKGLIYRGKRLVNWDTKLQTAVADDEIYYEHVKGHFWTFKYPLADGSGFIPVSTTRPETIMGDTALAVHPSDERYAQFIGKMLKVPFVDREIPVIADAILVDKDFGTGSVKVTPAHDPNDYATGLRHKLPMINIMNDDGTLNENAGKFQGLKGQAARDAVVAGLEELGLLIKVEDHEMDVGHSDRSKTVIEPYLSDQWFVKMDVLAENAMNAVKSGEIKIIPERYANKYLDWLGEKRDWCISRQLWWGHRIPIWHTDASEEELKAVFGNREDIFFYKAENGGYLVCSQEENLAEDAVPGHVLKQEDDVLDTWFSSGLWPHSTMGWPENTDTLKKYYPTSVLVTSRDIITLWVARMVLFSQENMGTIPFHTVYIHPKILDGNGMTMSKSKGNGVDPMDIERKYGTDALRFVMASLCTDNQDVRLPVKKEKQEDGTEINTSEKFEIGRNFSNKIWNACRFLYPQLEQAGALAAELPMDKNLFALEDKWILSRLQTTIKDATRMLEEYHFAELAGFLYRFVWDDVCSQYLEIKKAVINSETLTAEKKNAMAILSYVLKNVLDLLHPVMPFITEELNSILFQGSEMVISRPWPTADESLINKDIEAAFDQAFAVVEAVRGVRGRYSVSPATKLKAVVSVDDAATEQSVNACLAIITELGGIESITVGVKAAKPKFSASAVVPGGELFIPLEGILDPAAEIARLEKEIEKAKSFAASIERKLSNEKFVNGAPEAVVNAEKVKLATQQDIIAKNEKALAELK